MSEVHRVLVCGGRDYADRETVFSVLEYTAEYFGKPLLIIQGGAWGADYLARQWAAVAGCECVTVKADWHKHGKAAGPLRNQKMLEEQKPDAVLAFPGGRGTADMVQRARAAGVPVKVVQ